MRLRRWLDRLVESKHSKALADPELFATYIELTAGARDVVKAHVETLVAQLTRIVNDGVAEAPSPPMTRGPQRVLRSTRRVGSTTLCTRPSGAIPRSTMPSRVSALSSSAASRYPHVRRREGGRARSDSPIE